MAENGFGDLWNRDLVVFEHIEFEHTIEDEDGINNLYNHEERMDLNPLELSRFNITPTKVICFFDLKLEIYILTLTVYVSN